MTIYSSVRKPFYSALVIAILVGVFGQNLAYAQAFNPFAGTGKTSVVDGAAPAEFKVVELSGGLTEISLSLDPQKMVRFDNPSEARLYRISVATDAPGPLTLQVMQLELTGDNQVVERTLLLRSDVNGGQATALSMPETLLPVGPLFIGVGARGTIKAVLRIEAILETGIKPLKDKDSLRLDDDRIINAKATNTCVTLPKSKTGVNLSVTTLPSVVLSVKAYKKSVSRNALEVYNKSSNLEVLGLKGGIANTVCISTKSRTPANIRVQTKAAKTSDEPDARESIKNIAILKPGGSLSRTTFNGDTDAFRIARARPGKAHKIQIFGVLSAKACFKEAAAPLGYGLECIDGVRTIMPVLGGGDVIFKLSDMLGGDGNYTVKSTLIDFDPTVDRSEPNQDVHVTQSPPSSNSKTGFIRLKGSHLSSGDKDTYHWADITEAQLWRIRALGPGLKSGEIMLDGKLFVRLQRPPGITGRLQADDVYLPPGRAEITLRGDVGNYSVFMRPLGAPPKGFELERGADGTGQILRFAEVVTGQLKRGDVDRYRISLKKPVAVTLDLNPPLGSAISIDIASVLNRKKINHDDAPLELILPAGDHEIILKPVIPSPMAYKLTLLRRNPFAVEGGTVTMKIAPLKRARAWSDVLQRVPVVVELTNGSNKPVSGKLRIITPNYKIVAAPQDVTLKAMETKTVKTTLKLMPDIAPDSFPIMVGVLRGDNASLGAGQVNITTAVNALDIGGRDLPAVPERLIGALNVAHRDQGATWVLPISGKHLRGDEFGNLVDGLWITAERNQAKFDTHDNRYPTGFTLKLGGETPVALSGVGFALVGKYSTPLGQVNLETSVDGMKFKPWFSGRNDYFNTLQYMTGPKRMATHVRLTLDPSKKLGRRARLSEFYVFAEPGQSELPAQDLLKHGNGAKSHLNKGTPAEQSIMQGIRNRRHKFSMLKQGENASRLIGAPISFKNIMSAQIESVALGWAVTPRTSEPAPDRLIMMGADSVSGPWREIGVTDIANPETNSNFRYEFPERADIKFIRFDFEADAGWHTLPARFSAFERAEGSEYLSVLAQWGGRRVRTRKTMPPLRVGGTLPTNGSQLRGTVQFDVDEDIWTLKPKRGDNVVSLTIDGAAGFDPALLVTQNDVPLKPLNTIKIPGSTLRKISYRIVPNTAVRVDVREDKRSVYILAKTNGGMKEFRSRILNGIVKLSEDMVVGQDAVAFSAMEVKVKRPWITDPSKVSREVVDYFARAKGGADDSEALREVAQLMAKRSGTKSIIMISDGASSEGDPELETALEGSRARLFIMKPPGGVVDMTYAPTNDVLNGWAQISGGDVQFDTSLAGYERIFSRVSAKMQGPKFYTLSARTQSRVFEPGSLRVIAGPLLETEGIPKRTQLVLLDTSGSMLKRIDGARRFAVARGALQNYVTSQASAAPEERFDFVGLRLFGGPAESCETTLALPPAPLGDGKFEAVVNEVTPKNNAKTPIAAALRAAGKDMANLEGDFSLLLLTDGEETCGGSPLIEIKALAKAGLDVRLDVVSFALSNNVDRDIFKSWANAGGGRYVDAQNGTELAQALTDSRARGFQVLDGDEIIAAGQVGAAAIQLPVGEFSIQFEGSETTYPIKIHSGRETEFKP